MEDSGSDALSDAKPIRVCFVAPHSYSLFNRGTHFVFGGIEVQAYLTAIELARRPGFEVSFVVFNHGQPRRTVDNVDVIPYTKTLSWRARLRALFRASKPKEPSKTEDPTSVMMAVGNEGVNASRSPTPVVQKGSGTPGKGRIVRLRESPITRPIYFGFMAVQNMIDFLRVLHWAWDLRTAHRKSMKSSVIPEGYYYYVQDADRVRTYCNIDADLFIGFGANDLTAELVACARLLERRVLLIAASDSDFHDSYFWGSNIRNYYGDLGDRCHYALVRAHHLITQNTQQKELALKEFRRESTVIANPIDLSASKESCRSFEDREHILWIGKADKTKQPEVLVAVAQALPEIKFYMVLNPSHEVIEQEVRSSAPSNVTIVAGVARSEVPELMERAFALLNTSRFEGYPNTFLEAYRASAAVVSLNVDPNDVISSEGTGVFASGDLGQLVDGCKRVATEPESWRSMSKAGKSYVHRVHGQAVIVDELISQINLALNNTEDIADTLPRSSGGRPLAPAYYQD